MKLRTLAMLVAMGLAPAALAQAPAAPAAKPNIPKLCTNCHKAEANEVYGAFEGAAFKSRSIQLKIDAATEIVKYFLQEHYGIEKNYLNPLDRGNFYQSN